MKKLIECLIVIGSILALPSADIAQSNERADDRHVSAQTFERWMSELSNWGRWGKDDERGTINFITPRKRVEAAKLVKSGITVSLERDLNKKLSPTNPHPFNHEMYFYGEEGTSDRYSIDYHGIAHSHLDALCHQNRHGKIYNGFSLYWEGREAGCRKDSVFALADGIFTRGVLIDIAYLSGASSLEPGTAIMSSDLDAWEKRTKVKIRSGDAVLLRTGRWSREDKQPIGGRPGIHASAVRWLRDRDVSIVGSDWPVEVWPSGVENGPPGGPVHALLLVAMGTPLLDNLDLERLKAEAEREERWDFLLTIAPLRVRGGTGSPVNPIAIF